MQCIQRPVLFTTRLTSQRFWLLHCYSRKSRCSFLLIPINSELNNWTSSFLLCISNTLRKWKTKNLNWAVFLMKLTQYRVKVKKIIIEEKQSLVGVGLLSSSSLPSWPWSSSLSSSSASAHTGTTSELDLETACGQSWPPLHIPWKLLAWPAEWFLACCEVFSHHRHHHQNLFSSSLSQTQNGSCGSCVTERFFACCQLTMLNLI